MRVDPTTDRRRLLAAAATTCAASALAGEAASEAVAAAGPGDLMTPGVSRGLARARAAELADVRYDLALDVTRRDRAPGRVAIAFVRSSRAGDLILDHRGGDLAEVVVNGRPVAGMEVRGGHVRVPAAALRPGENRLEAAFSAAVAPAGAPIIRFDDPADGQTYLYTLLVPSDANLLFPCFDQPDLKARVRWTVTAPAGWEVLANAGVESRTGGGTTETWRFGVTEPIPTYLAAFAAGPWAAWRSAPAGERPITLYARASRRKEVEADAIISANRNAARWLASWFGVPFPFAKLDALLAPAFPFGGMEHVGAIFYNENSFVFREPPTLSQRLARDDTVYHEVSHQWFGDDVTMRWFDDLWLKEGFATYMGARVQNALEPNSDAWKTFYLRNKPSAYAVDATRGTTPVWQDLDNLDQAKSAYGAIVYNKAPAILKQLAYFAGEEGFRRGLRLYLTRRAYGNATWRDLLGAVQEASRIPLQRFGRNYILRAGMPRIDTVREARDGRLTRLELAQRPARALPGDSGGWWPMKLRVRLGYQDRPDVVLPVVFSGPRASVPGAAGLPAPDYVWANDGDYGYGLFIPDPASAAWIADHVGAPRDGLLRAMMWGSLWDLLRDGRLPPDRFVEIAGRELPREADEQIAEVVLRRGNAVLQRYAADAQAERLGPGWERRLLALSSDPAKSYGLRKSALDALTAVARSPEGLAALRSFLSGERRFDGAPVQPPTRWNIVRRLLARGEPDAEALYAAESRRDVSPEGPRSAFVAGAAARDPARKAAYFARYLDDPDLNEEWVMASLSAFNEPDQTALTLPYLRRALERLEWIREHRRIFFLGAWVNAFVGGQKSAEALAQADEALAPSPRLPVDIRRKVLQARDELEVVVRVRSGPA